MPKKQPHILKQNSLPNWVIVVFVAIFALIAGYFAFGSFALQQREEQNGWVWCRPSLRDCRKYKHAGFGTHVATVVNRRPNCKLKTGLKVQYFNHLYDKYICLRP